MPTPPDPNQRDIRYRHGAGSGWSTDGTTVPTGAVPIDPEPRTGPVETLHQIADQDIGANAPWLADRLHVLADQLAAEMAGERQWGKGDQDREDLGRLVRDTWVRWAREQYEPKPSWLTGWDDLDDDQREVDMRIGEAVAVTVYHRLAEPRQ